MSDMETLLNKYGELCETCHGVQNPKFHALKERDEIKKQILASVPVWVSVKDEPVPDESGLLGLNLYGDYVNPKNSRYIVTHWLKNATKKPPC